jgi:predicted transcriptional regulator
MTQVPLGELELAVLKSLWQTGAAPAKSVHRRIGTRRSISLNTIQSTLERLYRKGLLARRKVSHAYHYEPAVERGALAARMVDQILGSLAGDRADMLAAFVDLVERTDSEELARLERMIAARRHDGGADDDLVR